MSITKRDVIMIICVLICMTFAVILKMPVIIAFWASAGISMLVYPKRTKRTFDGGQ